MLWTKADETGLIRVVVMLELEDLSLSKVEKSQGTTYECSTVDEDLLFKSLTVVDLYINVDDRC